MDELPGNPYYFEGSDEYWALEAKFKKKFDEGELYGKERYTRKRESVGECPICYDDIDQGFVTTNCGHTLCLECFENTIYSGHDNCPMCRSTMITGITSNKEVDRLVKKSYSDGWEDGYEEGSQIIGELAQHDIDKMKMKYENMRDKYKGLKRIYNGTIRQLNSTHTLNLKQKKVEGSIIRTSSV